MKIVEVRRAFWTNHNWFSLGIHVDFDKRYMDIHIGKKLVTFGNNKIDPEIQKKRECFWKEYCQKCRDLEKQEKCSMGCHDQ